jgi:hypothetical protein
MATATSNSDNARVAALKRLVAAGFADVVSALGINLRGSPGGYEGPCPIHGGDKVSGLLLYTDGHTSPGYWRCHTRGCHNYFPQHLLGFVQGVLSRQQYGWSGPTDRKASFNDAVKFCCTALRVHFQDLKGDETALERSRFNSALGVLGKKPCPPGAYPREKWFGRLACPSPYYLERGFRPETLAHFDVGDAPKGSDELAGRSVVPVYVQGRKCAGGFSGRTHHPKCEDCKRFHPPGPCPPDPNDPRWAKWRHSKGFRTDSVLYNWGDVKASGRHRVVVLTEGPGEVWRLWEAGVQCGVAQFGCDLSDSQQVILEAGGVLGVIVALNKDEPGRLGARQCLEKLARGFYTALWHPPGDDLGDSSPESVASSLLPLIASMESGLV